MSNIDIKGNLDSVKSALKNVRVGFELSKQPIGDDKISSIYFDGTVMRFLSLFNKTVKLLDSALKSEGLNPLTPLAAITEATRIGWIADSDFWVVALDTRTQLIAENSDQTPHELINVIIQFTEEVEVMVSLLNELKKIS